MEQLDESLAVKLHNAWSALKLAQVIYTASGSVTKPAVLETGMEIQVPLFIKEGEKIKVHTETREFAGRA